MFEVKSEEHKYTILLVTTSINNTITETPRIQKTVTMAERIVRVYNSLSDVSKRFFLPVLAHGRIYNDHSMEVVIFDSFSKFLTNFLDEKFSAALHLWQIAFLKLNSIHKYITIGECNLDKIVIASSEILFIPSYGVMKATHTEKGQLLKLVDVFNLLFNNSYFLKQVNENTVKDIDFSIFMNNFDELGLRGFIPPFDSIMLNVYTEIDDLKKAWREKKFEDDLFHNYMDTIMSDIYIQEKITFLSNNLLHVLQSFIQCYNKHKPKHQDQTQSPIYQSPQPNYQYIQKSRNVAYSLEVPISPVYFRYNGITPMKLSYIINESYQLQLGYLYKIKSIQNNQQKEEWHFNAFNQPIQICDKNGVDIQIPPLYVTIIDNLLHLYYHQNGTDCVIKIYDLKTTPILDMTENYRSSHSDPSLYESSEDLLYL